MAFAISFRPATKFDVLVVDDNPFMRAVVVRILQRQGRRCVAASTIDEAKSTLRDHAPALVLTDFVLGHGQTGAELVSWIRSQPHLAGVSCGMMSGTARRELDATLADAALSDLPLLPKPFGLKELEGWVDELLAPNGNLAHVADVS